MTVPSLSCLAGLPTGEATAKVEQFVWCHRVWYLVSISAAAAFFAGWKFRHSSKWTALIMADFPPL